MCGADLNALKDTQPQQQTEQPAPSAPVHEPEAAVKPEKETAPIFTYDSFKKHFWCLFVSTGLATYVLLQLASIWVFVTGLTIVFGIFAILAASAFLAIGIVNKVRASGDDKTKYQTRDNVCLSVSIIVFIYVVCAAITCFVIAA